MNQYNLDRLAKRKTIDLIKRFSFQTVSELEQIASREYGTNHFDITTVQLIVETLLSEALKAGLSSKQVATLGNEAINHYSGERSLSANQRELKHWQDNRSIHGTKPPQWVQEKLSR